jgi:uncharacterized protein (DUF1810 family)
MADDPFDLRRFEDAQRDSYERALAELTSGRKLTHWMWYVLPQLRGLGSSAMATRYGIASLDEARAYLAHPVLGPRLMACVAAMNALPESNAERVLGAIDAVKFRSCLTLVPRRRSRQRRVAHRARQVLRRRRDERTLALLKRHERSAAQALLPQHSRTRSKSTRARRTTGSSTPCAAGSSRTSRRASPSAWRFSVRVTPDRFVELTELPASSPRAIAARLRLDHDRERGVVSRRLPARAGRRILSTRASRPRRRTLNSMHKITYTIKICAVWLPGALRVAAAAPANVIELPSAAPA